jgi:hypothetical protein
MKKSITFYYCLYQQFFIQGHGVVGKWKTIDDQSGEEKSVVEIYENQEKFWKST